jgi:dolichol-phosphate mannosyltransferase
MKTLVILPTYNEIKNIGPTVKSLINLSSADLNILIVDDNSPDGTGAIADKLHAKHKGLVHVIHRPEKQGLGAAYLEGFNWASKKKYDIVCEMDADGSHSPKYLANLIKEIENGAYLAIGSRRVRGGKIVGWGWHRHLISWGATNLSRFILHIPVADITAGYRAYNKKAIKLILANNIKSNGYAFQEETLWLIYKKGLKIAEIPITFVDRKYGQSKLSPKDSFEFFKTLYRLRKLG